MQRQEGLPTGDTAKWEEPLLAVSPCTSDLTSLSLSFLLCKMGIIPALQKLDHK